MKIAKASKTDINILMTLAPAFDALTQRWSPIMPEAIQKPDEDSDIETFDGENPEQCVRALEHLLAIVDKGSIFRVALNLRLLLDETNKCIDHAQDHLEHYPLVNHEEAITNALTFYGNKANYYTTSSGFAAQYDPEQPAVHTDLGRKARDALALFHKQTETTTT